MRGQVKKWVRRGFAFVSAEDRGDDVFVHIRDVVTPGVTELRVGDLVSFDLRIDEQGRRKGVNVSLSYGDLDLPAESRASRSGVQSNRKLSLEISLEALNCSDGALDWLRSQARRYRSISVVPRLLTNSEFRITSCGVVDDATWSCFVNAPKYIAGSFALAQEILVVISEWPQLQHRTIEQIENLRAEQGGRLAQRLVLLFHSDSAVERKIPEFLAHRPPYSIVADSLDTASRHSDRRLLYDRLRKRLGSIDLFDVPVPTSDQFFGRVREIGQAIGVLGHGAHVGLFGTRKVGKTALLYKLQEELRRAHQRTVIYMDVSAVDASSPTAASFVATLSRHLAAAEHIEGPPLTASLAEGSDWLATFLSSDSRSPAVVLIDEIERMWPFTADSPWVREFVKAWRVLRTHAQQNPGRLQFVVTGRNPTLVETQRVFGQENPIFEFFSIQYLRPLTKGDAWKVFTRLGAQMGMSFHAETANHLMNLTGGHPKLIRLMGSTLHRKIPERPTRIGLDRVTSARSDFAAAAAATASEIVDLLADTYPTEYEILVGVATGDATILEYSAQFPEEWRHLESYGLLSGGTLSPRITIAVVRDWLQRPTKAEGSDFTEPVFGRYQSERLISQTGLSEVWKGTDIVTSSAVAIKIFRKTTTHSLELAERESDVLNAISSPRMARFLHYGTAPDGRACIVIEWIHGSPVSELIRAPSHLSWNDAVEIGVQVLEALIDLHPNMKRAAALRKKPELTFDEYRDLQLAEAGYIHRDVKPANIVWSATERRAYLIDFNISSRAGDQIGTLSNTPGYIPPDYFAAPGEYWTPDIDVFATGVVIYELIEKQKPYSAEQPFEPRKYGAKVPGNVAQVLLRAVRPLRKERYQTAREFKEALERSTKR